MVFSGMIPFMQQITVRYRVAAKTDIPPFSARNFRALSLGGFDAATPQEGFADITLDIPEAATGVTLAQAVYLSGKFQTPALCSGLGRCGLCRMRFLSNAPAPHETEEQALSHHDIDVGWRLACRHAPQNGMYVLVPALPASPVPDTVEPPPENATASLAVDLGTTSVHWRFTAPGYKAETMPHGVMTNPQMGAGSDVISRLSYAATGGGAATLRRLAVDAIQRIIRQGAHSGFSAETLCVAANPAMAAIFLGQSTRPLAHAPYGLPDPGGKMESVPGLPPVYVPPHISPFIGADISAGYAAIALNPKKGAPAFPFLMADLGTNGECILALSPETAFAASLPMGPALEGINLACGSQAAPGAVTEYALTPYGLEPKIMGDTAPTGITATGYLSLLRILRALNLLGEDGLFIRPQNALGERGGGAEYLEGQPAIRLPGKMLLFASDVEEILKVKAAFTLAVSRLLATAGLAPADVRHLYLAGSLGVHAPVNALVELGFLPSVLGPRVVFAGNTALLGAELLLAHPSIRESLAAWAKRVTALDLANDEAFSAAFAEHMAFAWIR
jgi:uncharacterized 2Fe-2S/4Fe-4S cluster protein (DUF4445 family)